MSRIAIITDAVVERFWQQVQKTDTCWIWTGSNTRGYGVMAMNGAMYRVHRFSWELHNGPIPKGLMVCHRCDNPSCVRPDHLYAGSAKQNMHDCLSRGRYPYRFALENPKSKLTPNDVRMIREVYPTVQAPQLARRYGVHKKTIYDVIHRRSWLSVEPQPRPREGAG